MKLRLVRVVWLALAAQFVLDFFSGQAVSAQVVGGNRYGIVTIHNKTEDTLNYSYRIGNGAWQQASIKPGHYRSYSHEYAYANENRSPSFHIRFDSDMGPGVAVRQFTLRRNFAPYVNPEFGRHYDFRRQAGNQINIFAR
jgi:hypothetical protein